MVAAGASFVSRPRDEPGRELALDIRALTSAPAEAKARALELLEKVGLAAKREQLFPIHDAARWSSMTHCQANRSRSKVAPARLNP